MSEVLWNVRLLDPETGEATERRVITIDGDTVTAIDEVDGDPPPRAPGISAARRSCPA